MIRRRLPNRLVNRMILHAVNNPDAVGLFYGQMGLTLVIAQIAKQREFSIFETSADFLFDNISKQVGRVPDVSFANGLSGICWGVEYLVTHDLMPGPADDVCSEADSKIMDRDVRRIKDFSLATGALGLWHYVQARICGNLLAKLPLPFDSTYLKDWSALISKNREIFPIGAETWLLSVINGNRCSPIELSVLPYVRPHRSVPVGDLSLHSGLAGYIAALYLDRV